MCDAPPGPFGTSKRLSRRSAFDVFLPGNKSVAPSVLDRVLLGIERCAAAGVALPTSRQIGATIGRSVCTVDDAFRVLLAAGFVAGIAQQRRKGARVVTLWDGRTTGLTELTRTQTP